MLLVILGAGASFDSLSTLPTNTRPMIDNIEHRPPLAAELFEDRRLFRIVESHHPVASRLFPVLRANRAQPVEDLLDGLFSERPKYTPRIQQLASLRFYIRELLEIVCHHWLEDFRSTQLNHHALLDQINFGRRNDEPVLLVTFNYDTFLEAALKGQGLVFQGMGDYIQTGRQFHLFKLHGSIDWSREVFINGDIYVDDYDGGNGAFGAAGLVKYAPQWDERPNFVLGNFTHDSGRHFVPAIAVPVKTKIGYQCPQAHIDLLTGLLPRVDRILTIGWAGQDQHFLDLLGKHTGLCKVWTVGGDADKSHYTLQNVLNSRVQVTEGTALPMGFSDFVSRRAGRDIF